MEAGERFGCATARSSSSNDEASRRRLLPQWGLVSFCNIGPARLADEADFKTENRMRRLIGSTLLVCGLLGPSPAMSQVKMTRDQMLFYTSDWRGDRFLY